MKLKYFFSLFIAIVALITSCSDENQMTLLDEIQVSSSYVSIPQEGGSTTITVTAKDSWTAEKVTTAKDPVEWLTISSTTGSAGETELKFSAESTLDGRNAQVLINCGGKTQRINIIQGLANISEATVAEVIAGPDGKTYRVTGVCTSIASTVYGNWNLTDETGTLYVYGTLDAKGGKQNFLSLGIEVGDEITVQGPKLTYNNTTVELVDVTVININKSLVKVDSVENAALPVEGGEFTAYITCKGQGVSVDIPEDAKSWLSISSIQSAGTNVVVKFQGAANTGGDRSTTITFRTTDGKKEYTTQTSLTQKGAIVSATNIAAFLGLSQGTTATITGSVTVVYQNGQNLYVQDNSGYLLVYTAAGGATFANGDQLKGLTGVLGIYGQSPQMTNPVLPTAVAGTPVEPTDYDLASATTNDQSRYIKVSAVQFVAAVAFSTTSTVNGTLVAPSGFVVRDNFRLGGSYAAGTNYDITGFLNYYNGTPQLYPVTIVASPY